MDGKRKRVMVRKGGRFWMGKGRVMVWIGGRVKVMGGTKWEVYGGEREEKG